MIFGYNQASAGSVLADPNFNHQFPVWALSRRRDHNKTRTLGFKVRFHVPDALTQY